MTVHILDLETNRWRHLTWGTIETRGATEKEKIRKVVQDLFGNKVFKLTLLLYFFPATLSWINHCCVQAHRYFLVLTVNLWYRDGWIVWGVFIFTKRRRVLNYISVCVCVCGKRGGGISPKFVLLCVFVCMTLALFWSFVGPFIALINDISPSFSAPQHKHEHTCTHFFSFNYFIVTKQTAQHACLCLVFKPTDLPFSLSYLSLLPQVNHCSSIILPEKNLISLCDFIT